MQKWQEISFEHAIMHMIYESVWWMNSVKSIRKCFNNGGSLKLELYCMMYLSRPWFDASSQHLTWRKHAKVCFQSCKKIVAEQDIIIDAYVTVTPTITTASNNNDVICISCVPLYHEIHDQVFRTTVNRYSHASFGNNFEPL